MKKIIFAVAAAGVLLSQINAANAADAIRSTNDTSSVSLTNTVLDPATPKHDAQGKPLPASVTHNAGWIAQHNIYAHGGGH